MVIPKGTTHEFWKTIHAGPRQRHGEGNAEILWIGPQKEDDRQQQIDWSRTRWPARSTGSCWPRSTPRRWSARGAGGGKGIPVVIIDSALDSDDPVSYVATDNYHGGVLAAERLAELLVARGRSSCSRYAVGSAAPRSARRGSSTRFEEYPKITFLSDDQYAGATSDSAQKVSQSLVTRYRGQVDGIFAPNESSTSGCSGRCEDAGMLKTLTMNAPLAGDADGLEVVRPTRALDGFRSTWPRARSTR